MTLLAPDLVEAALAGRQPEGMTLAWAMGAWPGEWEGQRGDHTRTVKCVQLTAAEPNYGPAEISRDATADRLPAGLRAARQPARSRGGHHAPRDELKPQARRPDCRGIANLETCCAYWVCGHSGSDNR